ncbi:hypothetical protein IKG45_00620 [Candidatus Saccharibacteria bacterium]|nr:hypothetical protein [Candidatus Saccharibacteria bacterium]
MNKRNIIKTIIWLIFLGAVAFAIINFQALKDTYFAMTFSPSNEISEIEKSLELTDKGHRIFFASSPVINTADDFNQNCKSAGEDVSTLGCYNGQRIYIYNIDSEELKGIKESTAAHELLHAVWQRLSTADRENLIPTLESVYEKSSEDFKKTLKTYDESAKTEEIYVRSATQIKSLPENLEKHYAEIFEDQDRIVDFYESYIAPFNAIEQETEALHAELDEIMARIEQGRADYDVRSTNFSTAVTEFNDCASVAGCFASNYAFSTRRSELLAEQSSLNDLLNSINADIDLYNSKAELYNSKVIHGRELNSIINSKQPEIEQIAE